MPNIELFTIASAAKTLTELKKLPPGEQAMLLLKRLAQIFPQVQGTGGLNKGNLLLPEDPYGLARGFSEVENMEVRRHVLGSAWTRLVNDGYLVDPAGTGFFSVSDEGIMALETPVVPKAAELPTSIQTVPKVFLSYSYDSIEHRDWVLELAERLQGKDGVSVVLDQWHLARGDDKALFMEQSIANANFVLIICTPEYARKANSRKGGVGYEAMILTGQLANSIEQRKFIPVLRAGEWETSLPIWIQSRLGVDLRGEDYREDEYDELLRDLYRQRRKPPKPGLPRKFTDLTREKGSASAAAAFSAIPEPQKPAAGKAPVEPSMKEVRSGPVLVAQFQEANGELVKSYGEKDDLPSLGIDLWVENAPITTDRVYFEITDLGADDRKWSVKRKKQARKFLTDDMNCWGNLEILVVGNMTDGGEWSAKSWLYEALKRYYGSGRHSKAIKEALEQILKN